MALFVYFLAPLFVGILALLVATVPLAFWLGRRRHFGLAVASGISGAIIGVVVAYSVFLHVALGFADQKPSSLHLINSSDSDIFVVWPRREPTDRSSADYRRVRPGSDGNLGFVPSPEGFPGVCTWRDTGRIVRIPDDYEIVHYLDPVTRQYITEDPDPSIITELATLPEGWCFPAYQAWIKWDGESFRAADPPRTWLRTKIAGVAAVPSALLLALGGGIDYLVAQSRQRRQQLPPSPQGPDRG